MSSNKFKVGDRVRCVRAENSCCTLALGEVYSVSTVNYLSLTINAGGMVWNASRFELVEEAAPARKVKGYIFRDRSGTYYLALGEGYTTDVSKAYVYTMQEITNTNTTNWGNKTEGKWRIVYE